jgi:diaminopimelate epimerase
MVKLIVPGGILTVEITDGVIMMTGPAENVFSGEMEI